MTSSKPNAGFQVGLAMNRNKYIYASSKATFIVASDYNKGGTWAGVTENMRNNWTKTFIKEDTKSKGVQELIKLGVIPIKNIEEINLVDLINNSFNIKKQEKENCEQISLDTLIQNNENNQFKNEDIDIILTNDKDDKIYNLSLQKEAKKQMNFDLYYQVIDVILEVLKEEKNIEELSKILNVKKSQASEWVKRGIEDGKIKKLFKPVRYIKNK